MKTKTRFERFTGEPSAQIRRRARRIRRLLQEAAAARPTFYPARMG